MLVVDDEPALIRVLAAGLSARGYEVITATSGREALDRAAVDEPDVVVLDLGLPDIDGIAVCRQLRRWVRNPVIVLTADGAEDRKVLALDEGADDYVTKPFSMPELLARVRVALRHRRVLAAIADDRELVLGGLRVDVAGRQAMVDGRVLELTPKEFDLLTLLARNAGRVLTHRTILEQVWDREQSVTTLRTHVNQLRNKLGRVASGVSILTEPGVGYRLVEAGSAP